jgi:hypothetical protein
MNTPLLYVRTLGSLPRLLLQRLLSGLTKQEDQDVLRKLLDQLTHDRLFIVVSTTNCHEYECDSILSEADLTNIRAAGIDIIVDGDPEAVEQEEEAA